MHAQDESPRWKRVDAELMIRMRERVVGTTFSKRRLLGNISVLLSLSAFVLKNDFYSHEQECHLCLRSCARFLNIP
jgi:hypothetical protein